LTVATVDLNLWGLARILVIDEPIGEGAGGGI